MLPIAKDNQGSKDGTQHIHTLIYMKLLALLV